MGSCLGKFLKKSDSEGSKYASFYKASFNDDCFEPLLREESEEILAFILKEKPNIKTKCKNDSSIQPSLEGDCKKFSSPVYEMHRGEGDTDTPLRRPCCNCICDENIIPSSCKLLESGQTWNAGDPSFTLPGPSSENDSIMDEESSLLLPVTESYYSEPTTSGHPVVGFGLPARENVTDNFPSLICFNI